MAEELQSNFPNCKRWPHNPPHCGCPAGQFICPKCGEQRKSLAVLTTHIMLNH